VLFNWSRRLILLSVTNGLDKPTLKARLRWWLTIANKTVEAPVSRRIALVTQSALGQFQVRVLDSFVIQKTTRAHCRHPVRVLIRGSS